MMLLIFEFLFECRLMCMWEMEQFSLFFDKRNFSLEQFAEFSKKLYFQLTYLYTFFCQHIKSEKKEINK
jgi:hypothetical protein